MTTVKKAIAIAILCFIGACVVGTGLFVFGEGVEHFTPEVRR